MTTQDSKCPRRTPVFCWRSHQRAAPSRRCRAFC